MADAVLHATVRETGASAYAAEINVDGHILIGDEPEADGGRNLGPFPHEMLLAALGACTAMTVRWYALRHGVPLVSVDVALTYRRGPVEGRTGPVDVFTKDVHLVGPDLTPEQRARLLDVAKKCPIQRLMEGTPVIHTTERTDQPGETT